MTVKFLSSSGTVPRKVLLAKDNGGGFFFFKDEWQGDTEIGQGVHHSAETKHHLHPGECRAEVLHQRASKEEYSQDEAICNDQEGAPR